MKDKASLPYRHVGSNDGVNLNHKGKCLSSCTPSPVHNISTYVMSSLKSKMLHGCEDISGSPSFVFLESFVTHSYCRVCGERLFEKISSGDEAGAIAVLEASSPKLAWCVSAVVPAYIRVSLAVGKVLISHWLLNVLVCARNVAIADLVST